MAEHGWLGPIEWAARARPRKGESVCGDRLVALNVNGTGALFGVLDGLGHGASAAEAAKCGVNVLRSERAKPLADLVQSCHRALSGTRGAAITLARIDFRDDTLSWIGIGNVTADLVAKHPAGIELRASARLAGGIVGYRIPEALTPQQVAIRPGDLLVIVSDGIDEGHLDEIDFSASSLAIADEILHSHAKDNDDALVLAARHRGASG
jgi:negative regulator of sigma-B (phosphoserine phosphatase)